MSQRKRSNRTITVFLGSMAVYLKLILDGKKFIGSVVAFLISINVDLRHKENCPGGFDFTRHSSYSRIRNDNLIIWRIQCKHCKAVFTVLPHFVLRYRKMSSETAKKALIATNGGLSLENCSGILNISAMSIYRFVCGFGRQSLVMFLYRCGLQLPEYIQADEKHSKCRAEKVYLPTITSGFIVWHLGYVTNKNADAFLESYKQFKDSAETLDSEYRVKGILTDGFESTIKSLRSLFPTARIGNCILHAAKKVNSKLKEISSVLRKDLSFQFFDIFKRSQERHSLKLVSFSQRLRHFVRKISKIAGEENGKRIAQWIKEKKKGWFSLLEDPNMPVTSTQLDHTHNAFDRKIFMMKGFHHMNGSHSEFVNGLAILHNLIPYQRRAKNAGKCGIQVEGGKLPSEDWFLSLQILSSGGFQWAH
jgi:transposase-like protein